jgi:AAA lid domain
MLPTLSWHTVLGGVQVAAYTNGRTVVTEHDALLLQYVAWSRPEDQKRVYDWLLASMAVDSDLKQTNYLLASLFGRTCHSLDVRTAVATRARLPTASRDVGSSG